MVTEARTHSGSPSGVARYDGLHAARKDHICVAVRFRPLSDKERERGDHEVWNCEGNAVGVLEADVGMSVKFVYDHVFDGYTPNQKVYSTVASSIVQSAMDGINGTIFAYGVTSSGKTHTMMGDDSTPGIVPHAIAEVYALVAKFAKKEFLLRLSMLEIYNEVVNDLLDPSNTNLRLRQDPRRGVYVEGIKEERLMSAEHALLVVATGNEHRKISATAFNEGSSRSHTVIRLTIEASDRPEYSGEPDGHVSRTLSFLTMVDLAGSESAKAEVNHNQRVEGSFINKSLLTLSTVIHKLSEGGAAHIPFRDSKLTRLLSNSLTGNAARMAVICTITPAATQAEETHNTLKFASRAKKIALEAKRNEIMDQSSLIARYQQEISLLRRQLDIVMRDGGAGAGLATHDPMHPEVRTLRERWEEEHMAVVEKERERGRLAERVDRLTRCVLDSTAALSHLHRRLLHPGLGATRATAAAAAAANGGGSAGEAWRARGPEAVVAAAVMAVRGAGELFPGEAAIGACARRTAEDAEQVEVHVLRRQVIALADELREHDRVLRTLASAGGGDDEVEGDVTLHLMQAEREYMRGHVEDVTQRNRELEVGMERMCSMLAAARGVAPESIDVEAILAAVGDSGGAQQQAAMVAPVRRGYDHVLAEKVLKMEEKVGMAIEALQRKEERISNQRNALRTLTSLEDQVRSQLVEVTCENDNLKRELGRVEAKNEILQGHMLERLNNGQLTELIGGLTAAVNRVRLTVQLRNLKLRTAAASPSALSLISPERQQRGSQRMSMSDMKAALEDLQARGCAEEAAA